MIVYLLSGHPEYCNWDFYLQLYLAEIIILWGQKRRRHFYWRLLLSAVGLTIFALLVPTNFFRLLDNANEVARFFYSSAAFLLAFFVSVFLLRIPFKITTQEAIYSGIAAYTIQHTFFAVHKIVSLLWPYYASSYYLTKLLPTIPVVLASIFVCHIVTKNNFIIPKKPRMVSVSFLVLLINVVISVTYISYDYLYFIMVIVSGLILLLYQFSSSTENRLETKINQLNYMWETDRKNYEIQKKEMEDFNIKIHDLKHFIATFKGKIPDESLAQMESVLNQNYAEETTGCIALDVILNSRLVDCKKQGIQMTFIGDGREINFMEETDIYSVFANIIDNAMEAVSEVDEPSKKIISLALTKEKGLIVLSCSNYYKDEVVVIDGERIETTKKDSKHHGLGLKSVHAIISKYDGSLSIEAKDHKFHLGITFIDKAS